MAKPRNSGDPPSRSSRRRAARRRTRALVEEVEPRILLSADLPVAAVLDAALPPVHGPFDRIALDADAAREGAHAAVEQVVSRELVFVDTGVEGYEQIVEDLRSRSGGDRVVEVVLLDADRDGIEQIGEALDTATHPLDAVHVVSHGDDRGVQLGATWLDGETLAARSDAVAAWGEALADDADLLFYGCNLAGSAEGRALVDNLALLTEADVAASDDLTGTAALGGDWDLEYQTGTIEASSAVDSEIRWAGVLDVHASYEIANNESEVYTSADWGQTFSHTSGGGTYTVNQVSVQLREDVSAPQDITVSIRESWNGPVLASGVLPSSELGTSMAWEAFDVGSVELNDGQTYTLRISSNSPSGKVYLAFDDSGTYADGDRLDTAGAPISGADVAFRVEEQSVSSLSGDGAAIWTEFGSSTPEANSFDGGSWGSAGPTADIGGPWQIMAGAEAPTRDEKIVVGVDSGGNVSAQIWDGGSWTSFGDIASGTRSDRWGFDVAYESQSGDAVLVYNDGAGLSFQVWDGTSWSLPATIATPVAGEPEQMRLAASPLSDEMVLVVSNEDNQDYALVWDGSGWGNAVTLDSDGEDAVSNTDVHVAYEQQSGRAVVVFGKGSADAYYRIWTGSGWLAQGTIDAPGSIDDGEVRWTTVASDPNSNRIALGVISQDSDTWLAVWDGSSWVDSQLATGFGATNLTYNVDVAFESESGQAIATYIKFFSNEVSYRTWAPGGGGWSAEQSGPDFGSSLPATLTLDADPNSDRVMLGTVDASNDLNFALWDGTSWGSLSEQETNVGSFFGQPFLFLWGGGSSGPTVAADSIWMTTQDPVGAAPGPWDPGDLVAFGDPNLALGAGTTQGTFSVPFDVELFSAGTDVNALHYVGSDIQVGASSFQLEAGDLLLSVKSNGTINFTSLSTPGDPGFTNDLDVTKKDVLVFRPDTPGDYSAGTFALLLQDPVGHEIRGISLIESAVTVGDADLDAGDFLFTRSGPDDDDDIWLFETGDVGALTSGTPRVLLRGEDAGIAFDDHFYGVDLVEQQTTIGGQILAAGTVLVSVRDDASLAGIGVDDFDIVALDVTNTTLVAGDDNGVVTATVLFQGANVGLGAEGDEIDGFTLVPTVAASAPVLTPAAPSLTPITEDDTGNGGDLVSAIVGSSISDANGDPEGIAITAISSGNGTWEIDTGSGWTAVGVVSQAGALLLRDTDRIRFVPDGENGELVDPSFTYRAWDQTSGSAGAYVDVSTNGGETAFSTASDTATIAVSDVNDAPVLDATGTMVLSNVGQDETNPAGDTVASIIASAGLDRITDVDLGAVEGIAVVGADDTDGTWEYKVGAGPWTAFGSASDTTAVLLDESALVRFVPDPGYTGPSGDLTFRAWDTSDGLQSGDVSVDVSANGGTTAYSSVTETASLEVVPPTDGVLWISTPQNVSGSGVPGPSSWDDAEILEFGDPNLMLGDATAGTFTSVFDLTPFTADGNADIDGIHYVTRSVTVGSTNAIELYAGDVLLSTTGNETLGGVWVGQDDVIAFRPDQPGDYSSGTFFYVVNGIGITDLKDFALVEEDVNVGGMNLSAGSFIYSHEDTQDIWHWTPNDPVAGTGSTTRLIDTGDINIPQSGGGGIIRGIEIITRPQTIGGVPLQAGNLLVSLELDGTIGDNSLSITRHDIVVLDVTSAGNSTAADATLLLDGSDVGLDTNGEAVHPIALVRVNTAPVLTPVAPSLTPITEDDTSNAGDLVSSIVGSSITDSDPVAAEGIAITAFSSGSGTWEFSTDGGGSWNAVGAVSNASALLLRASDRIRFVPDGDNGEVVDPTFTYRAWDQRGGVPGGLVDTTSNGGATPFSLATDTASVAVADVNDAPTLAVTSPSLPDITEDETSNAGVFVSTLLGGVSDVDTVAAQGLAITGLTSGNGSWEYDTGSGWTAVGTVSETSALLLRASDKLRFVPDGVDADAASLSFRAWDQTTGSEGAKVDVSVNGGTTAFSVDSDGADITVTAVNDAPVLGSNALSIDEGGTVVFSPFELSATDVDDPVGSLAFTISNVVNGRFEEAANPGVAITSFTHAQVVAGEIQFVHDGGEAAPSYDVTVSDGSLADGPSAATITFTNRNDAPVLGSNALTLDEGGTVVLDGSALSATDDDDPDAGLVFSVSNVANGQFEEVANGGVAISSFTQAQVTAGEIQFVHDGGEAAPSYDVTVSDGSLADGPAAAAITFTNLNDPPALGSNTLSVDEGGTVVLSGSDLSATDVDDPDASLVFSVSNVANGQFEEVANGGVAITSFTQAQVTGGEIQFVHDGDEAAPSYDVTVSDGSLADGPVAASIAFTNLNDAPALGSNALAIDEGGTVVITGTDLSATDVDDPDATLVFTVSNVTNGRFEEGANPGVAIASFTQAQVSAGEIQFVHDGGEAPPAYDVVVGDGSLSDGPAAAAITFTNLNDPPVLGSNTLTIDEGGTVVLSGSEISATDADDPDAGLVFTVSSVANGWFEEAINPGAAIASFTQAQVTAGEIQFVHDGGEAAPAYDVTVSDGSLADGPTAALIAFTSQNDAPVLGNNSLTLVEGGTVVLSASDLSGTDVDDLDAGLVFSVSNVTNGWFEEGANPGVVITSFTQAQLLAGEIQFVHDGSEAAPAYDVTVGDGSLSDGPTAAVIAFSNSNDAPVVANLDGDVLGYLEGSGPLVIDQGGDALVTDVDSLNFAGGTLLVSITAGGDPAEDVLGIRDQGTGFGEIGVSGGTVTYEGTVIGSVSGGSGGADLAVTLNTSATPQAVSALASNITYENTDGVAATLGSRSVEFRVDDGNTGVAIVGTTVTVFNTNVMPAISGAVTGQAVIDTATVQPFDQVMIADPDVPTQTLTVLVQLDDPAKGVLTNLGGFADLGGGVYRFTGDATSATTAIQGLFFDPAENRVEPGDTETTTFTITVNDGVATPAFDTDTTVISTSVNDAPTLGNAALAPVLEDATDPAGASVTALFGAGFSDPDALSGLAGVAIVGNAAPAGEGSWEYSSDGASWFAVGTVSDGPGALALDGSSLIRFVPAPDWNGVPSDLVLRALDDTYIGLFSTTDSGEARVTVDTTTPGGSSSIAAVTSSLSTSVTADDDAPTLGANTLTIDEGGTVVLGASELSATDIDDPDAGLVFSVSSVTNGRFEEAVNPGVAIASFTQAQLTAGEIQFVHDGSATAPAYDVTVSDGSLADGPSAATIVFTNLNDAPALGNNALTVDEGGTVVLSGAEISATDVDDADADLVFSVSNVTNGRFEEGVNPGVAISSFTQAQVSAGEIQFVHDGGEGAPAYEVTVSDGSLADGPSAAAITFTNLNDAPVLGNNALAIDEGGSVVFSATELSATDADDPDASLVFSVANVANGRFEETGNPGVAIASFTQAQVSAGEIRFVHDGGEGAPAYDVTVSDGALADGPSAAAVAFTSLNDAPVLGNNTLTIVEGGSVVLSVAELSATDADDADPSLVFAVSSVSNGRFEAVANPGVGIASFTQAQVSAGEIRFVHNGGEVAPSYLVTVSDGTLSDGPQAANVAFSNQNDAPVLWNNNLTISEGGSVVLSVAQLGATDVDDPDAGLTFAISNLQNGRFEEVANPGVAITSFTQAQVSAGEIRFVHDGGEVAPAYDVTVSDGSLADGPGAAAISFSNQNDAPVLGANSLSVVEGGASVLSASDVSATDVDTNDATLTFTASNVTNGRFEEVANPGVAIANFTQAQVTVGEIRFVHDGGEVAPSYDITVSDGSLADGPVAATLSFSNVNDAPVLTIVSPTLPTITEDDTGNGGALVSALVGSSISDADPSSLEGVAVTAVSSGSGTWQYSMDGGASWNAMGAVAETSALLLGSADRVRFVPDGQNAATATLDYRAWDRTAGAAGSVVDASATGGSSAFSMGTDRATVGVTGVNDAPALAGAVLAPLPDGTANPNGASVGGLFGGSFSDVDAGAGLAGIAVVGNGASGTEGVWEYSSDGGASWFAIGGVGDGAGALALSAGTQLRFAPAADFSGVPSGLLVRGLDDSYAGGFSSTGGGSEARVNVDTSANGGTTPIAAAPAALSTAVDTALTTFDESELPGEGESEGDTETSPDEESEEDSDGGSDPETDEPVPAPDEIPPDVSAAPPISTAPAFVRDLGIAARGASDATAQERDGHADGRDADTPNLLRGLLAGALAPNSPFEGGAFASHAVDFVRELDQLREDIETSAQIDTQVLGSSIALTTGLSVGYVMWLTRGGLLLASLLSSMPAWRLIDPIPILARLQQVRGDDEEEESLDALLDLNDPPAPGPEEADPDVDDPDEGGPAADPIGR